MDAKALAKSKRAHSQHHNKRPHSSQKSKAPSDGSNDARNAKKPLGKQVGEKTRQPQHLSALPSNWERYEEEFDLDSTSQPSDVIMPKSKGADYSYLIAEAQSQSQSQFNPYSDSFPSLNDVLPDDFNEGVASMRSVRGEGILSWIGDDNFVVEDRTIAIHEASFLSLNLHALAEELEKVDLHHRLFIEEDLLPPELSAEGSKAISSQEFDRLQTTQESKATTRMSEELALHEFSKKVKIADEKTEPPSLAYGSNYVDSASTNPELNLVDQVKNESNSSQFGESSQSRTLESMPQFNVNPVATSKKKLSSFEASAAEAELDMLLNSLDENKVHDPSCLKSGDAFSFLPKEASTSLPQHSRRGLDSSLIASAAANLDDVLDDLLDQTSNLVKQNGLSHPREVKAVSHEIQSSSGSVTKSKVLDDFDSWLDTI